ncbi:MAG: hypothetical protein UDG86_00590 [Lachnospiraceae bacterium]|jgi:hypothetical protein|nr:hypothetical protein [Lachnospiraceae bacterium]
MKIYIKEPGRPALRILIPTSFLTGKIARMILGAVIRQKYSEVPEKWENLKNLDLKPFAVEIKRIRRQFKGLYLVDIEDTGGTVLKIRL